MATSNDSFKFQMAPQDAFFKAKVQDILNNKDISDAAKATAINQLIGTTYGGDKSKAYAAIGGPNISAKDKQSYDAFLAKGQPYITSTTNFKSTITDLLNNKDLTPEAQATAINLALAANNLTREQGALIVDPYGFGTTAGQKAVDTFLNKGGTGVVGGGVPSSLTGAVNFINKNLGLQEADIVGLARGVGLNYNPITDVLYNPTTKEATKIDTSKLASGTNYYGADNPLTTEKENYAPGTPSYIQSFINRLATDNPTFTSADFRKIAEQGFDIPADSFRPDSSGNTGGSFVINGVTYTIPKSTVVGGAGNDTLTGGTGNDYKGTVEGGKGVDFIGSSGLREFYGPYVTDYLSRASALLGLRDNKEYKPIKFGAESAGGTYGGETAKTLADLQTQRENMMSMGASKTPAYQPYNFSFAQKPMTTKPAAKGGIMSLVDHYDAGGAVGNVADTVVGGTNTGTSTYANQTVPSTFIAPTGYNANTYTSGYTTPTDIYKGPGELGITTDQFSQANLNRFINPYTSAVVDPQVREAKRQAELARQSQAAKFSQAGAFGGSRNILAENELGRNLATQIGDIYGRGQKEAFDTALKGFEAEQGRSLQAKIATEQARQAAGQQALSSAQTAGQLGLDASRLTEQSGQFAANLGLQTAQSEAQYQQLARDLQQRAEEAAARGDQFAASLALQQLQEANRAAESARAFEYQQARDTYLDPFRELGYASQLLQGLPTSASTTGISPATEALVSALGLNNILGVGNTTKTTTTTSDRRLKTDIQTIGVLGDGLKVYSYRYKSGGPVHIGVMADEVAVLRPQAYIKGGAGDGFDAVDYSKL